MPDVFLSIHCHVVFGTKDAQPLLRRSVAERLPEHFVAVISDQGAQLIAAGIMPDHVHLLVAFGRLTAVDDLVREVKNRSTDYIRNSFPDQGRFAWHSGYGAFSVSFSNLDSVREYVIEQESRHRDRSFREEFVALLRRHELAHDEHFHWW